MIYPTEKYIYVEVPAKKVDGEFVSGPKVIALSTYAGKTVKGIAKCHPHDIENYTLSDGMELAAARCGVNVAEKRVARATDKLNEALNVLNEAVKHYKNMHEYLNNAISSLHEAENHLDEIESKYEGHE